jgi:dipeptidyl aminopeptidase/acylaminoacyl peptidase
VAISPDGASIAFVMGGHPSAGHIVVMPTAGGAPRQVTAQPERILGLAWSPDGGSLAYTARAAGAVALRRVRLADGVSVQVAAGGFGPHLSWAPAQAIVCQRDDHRNFEVVNPESGARRPLVPDDEPGYRFYPLPTPDGRDIVLMVNPGSGRPVLMKVSLADGTQTQLSPAPGIALGWSPDGATLYARDTRAGGEHLILAVPAAGGEAQTHAELLADVRTDEIAHVPGTHAFVAIDAEVRSDLWLTGEFAADAVSAVAVPAP